MAHNAETFCGGVCALQLGNWYTWVVLPVFTFAALFWVTRLNKVRRAWLAAASTGRWNWADAANGPARRELGWLPCLGMTLCQWQWA